MSPSQFNFQDSKVLLIGATSGIGETLVVIGGMTQD